MGRRIRVVRAICFLVLMISAAGCARSYEILNAVEQEDSAYIAFAPGDPK